MSLNDMPRGFDNYLTRIPEDRDPDQELERDLAAGDIACDEERDRQDRENEERGKNGHEQRGS